MKKLNQSISVQRQIPDYIRSNYPYFVEFIKAYYEFLQQTQEKNLEGYRDIDTTLDEFLVRFKSELSENIPVSLAKDKRSLLRHIREFYLSRGSESSFKFLFKVLFEKDASLYYPSAQILRVSDGRWIQETYIFVRVNNPSQTLFPLIGKFVSVNTGTRVVEIYVSNVVEYKSDIYELSVLNEPSNQFIEVGNTVTYKEGSTRYIGTILKSPVKVSIYKKGKGFKLGDIFSLKTDLGNGCIVKVTGVDSDGGLKAISLIKFGLDYETKFWSYVSPGQLEGFEYIQPTTLWQNGTILDSRTIISSSAELLSNGKSKVTVTTSAAHNLPNSSLVTVTITSSQFQLNGTYTIEVLPSSTNTFSYVIDHSLSYSTTPTDGFITKPYQEASKGFIEYGYASKQNYLEYDSSIPISPNLGKESDRYYVDASYVGDIVNQFYNEQIEQDPLQDYAIIQVDVGALAKYPGYYAASNGFVSDETYIQDGYYYQIYSYVIRVEEEFKKYSDLVKNVLHPAGMKLFAEYNIFNEIDLQFLEAETRSVLQFSDVVQNIFDRGFNYSDYENTILFSGPDTVTTLNINGFEQTKPLTVQITPAPGSSIVNSPVGSPTLRPYKPIYSAYGFTQIAGRIESIQEAENRIIQLAADPTLQFPGHDVITDYFLEKNVTPTSTFVSGSDLIFGDGTAYITSTSLDLSIFLVGSLITISGAYHFTNNGTYIVEASSQNQLRIEDKQFTLEDVAQASPPYQVIIRAVGAPFNEYESPSSAGYGYSQYTTTLDTLTNPLATPNTSSKVYTRVVTNTTSSAGTLWNAEQIDIYNTPTNYKSHSAYYMSINSAIRSEITVSSYISAGSNAITATIANASSIFEVDDIIRISGATGVQQSNLNGTWVITQVSSNSINFSVYNSIASGTYSSNIGTAYTWRPNPNFTDYRFGASSAFGYTAYSNFIDSLGNPIVYPLDYNNSPITNNAQFYSDLTYTTNKTYTRDTSHLQSVGNDAQTYNYQDVSTAVTPYASHSAYRLSLNEYPRSTISVSSYSANGTNVITANIGSTSNLEVGDKIRISGITGTTSEPRRNLMGTWTITEKTIGSFKFTIYSPITIATFNTNIGTAVVWRPHSKFTDEQSLESTGYSFEDYDDSIQTTIVQSLNAIDTSTGNISSSQELAYSGTVETSTGPKQVNVYVSTEGSPGTQRKYSGNSTRTVITDQEGNLYTQIAGNTSDSSVLPHSTQRLNKVKVDSVGNSEDGRVVLNAYNEEAFWQNGYYSEDEINVNHYEAHNSIPFDGNTYVFANKPA